MPKLNEKQAWLEIAKAFNRFSFKDMITTFGLTSAGLCGAVQNLHCREIITAETESSMSGKLSALMIKHHCTGYLWNLDENGARKRVKAARKFANSIKTKKGQKNDKSNIRRPRRR